MRFRLIFDGEIRPRNGAKLTDIHYMPQQLHPQLQQLWEHPPLDVLKKWLREKSQLVLGESYLNVEDVVVVERGYFSQALASRPQQNKGIPASRKIVCKHGLESAAEAFGLYSP